MHEESTMTFEERGPIVVGTILAPSMLDARNVAKFGEDLMNYIQGKSGLHLILDFCHVEYLSSAVLTELIRAHKVLEQAKGALRLCSLNPEIQKVFEITNLDRLFVLHTSLDEAEPKFRRSLDIEASEDAWDQVRGDV